MTTFDHDRDAAISRAASYLHDAGFRVLDCSWQALEGSLDIVAADRQVLVVCDVQTRPGTRYGTRLEPIGIAKLRRLRALAVAWLNAHGVRFEQVRVDIIGLTQDGPGGCTIEHIRGAGQP